MTDYLFNVRPSPLITTFQKEFSFWLKLLVFSVILHRHLCLFFCLLVF